MYTPITETKFEKVTLDDIEEINHIIDNTNANIYLYFVETDSTYNFETNRKINIYDSLTTNLKIDKSNIATFNINSFEDYKQYFYKTDHHWNNKGSDKGYREIASLMNLENTLQYNDEICFYKIKSSGSKARNLGDENYFNDITCKYNYDFPEFKIISSGQEIEEYGLLLSHK